MKTELTKNGWKEIREINISKIRKSPVSTVSDWVSFTNSRLDIYTPETDEERFRCQRCKVLWKNISNMTNVNLCYTKDKEGFMICDECRKNLNVPKEGIDGDKD